MDYRVKPQDAFQIPDPSNNSEATNPGSVVKPKKKLTDNKPQTGLNKKGNDLEAALEKVSTGELSSFFEELRCAGSSEDIYLSWIKYVADALNSRIAKVPTPDVTQYPNDLEYPVLPRPLQETPQFLTFCNEVILIQKLCRVNGVIWKSEGSWYGLFVGFRASLLPISIHSKNNEFEEFFEASFDPKKRKDFEKFYPRIKELTLKSLNGRGSKLFTNFLLRVGEKDFNSGSAYGHETLEILHGCLENDQSVIAYWSSLVAEFPRESAALLNYLSNNVANVHCARLLESQFIQSDEFAVAAVKNPELLEAVKKLQVGVKRVEASRKRYSWKMATCVLLLAIIGLLWLDVAENGKGSFAKSNVGKFLETYGLLDEALYVGEQTSKIAKLGYGYAAPIFRNIYEGLRPLLQTIDKQLQIYIPEFIEFLRTLSEQITTYVKYLTEKVFVGSLSPENLRKLTKEVLSFVWTNLFALTNRLFDLVSLLIQIVQGYLL
ncbi:unnamed protein product [Allacma fusca]|uniref:Uncharacterized protein n=1 Tax=Allacma fusca TaxID=39272 RepID=A0A8J2LLL6_9HEXA|nr:unnamed protein product [Allacma fusca]